MKLRLTPESALGLAALRIVVPTLMLLGAEVREGARFAAVDPHLFVAPEGLGWFVRHVPIGPNVAIVMQLVAAFSALLAIAGVRARPALAALTLSAGYLFALADLEGWVWHDMHLLWFSALLAASPCDRALTVDHAGLAEESSSSCSTAQAWPLLFARLLLAAVYFFPGVHKVARSGFAWALSDNLQNQLYWKWVEHGAVPTFRIDAYPWLLQGGALFVLLFELSAPLLFVFRRTRALGAIAGIAFHLVAQALLDIPFLSLWGCYVILFDLSPAAGWVHRRLKQPVVAGDDPEPSPRRLPRSAFLVGGVGGALLLGATVQGVRGQMQAFPFACYPTFEFRAGLTMPDLRIVAIRRDGSEVDVPHARDANGYRTQRQWGTIWSLAGVGGVTGSRGTRERDERLLAYYAEAAAAAPDLVQGAQRVRFYALARSVRPEDRLAPPVSETRIADLAIP
jgi:hypothetical protein